MYGHLTPVVRDELRDRLERKRARIQTQIRASRYDLEHEMALEERIGTARRAAGAEELGSW